MEQKKAEPVVSAVSTKTNHKKLIHLLLPKVIGGLIIVAVIVAAVFSINIYRENQPRTGVCSSNLISQSYSNIVNFDNTALANNVSTIKGLKSYLHDPNCMYIITVYYLHTTNFSKAQSSLDQFNKDYKNNLNSLLATYWSADALRNNLKYGQKEAQALLQNSNELTPVFPSSRKASNK